jgi:hypothetical protein
LPIAKATLTLKMIPELKVFRHDGEILSLTSTYSQLAGEKLLGGAPHGKGEKN